MTLTRRLTHPFHSGSATSDEVPGRWDCALDGRPFMIDWDYAEKNDAFRWRSIKLYKPQQDTGGQIAENSLNPEEFMRRAAESWHKGAGQTHLDRPGSDEHRFRSSKGIDPWTMWQVSLLPDTTAVRASANTNLALLPVGTRLYAIDGTSVVFATTIAGLATGTAVTGLPNAAQSIATDGYLVWTAHGASGIYRTDRVSTPSTSYNTRAATLVAYVKGRLIAANGKIIVNITGTATETTILDHANPDWTWVAVAEGPNHIFMAGYSGDKSVIYRTTVKADGTALDVATVAGELPDGEIVRSIQGYRNFLEIGTDKGFRLATIDTNGNLVLGDLTNLGVAVRCFEPQESFVWFGWTNYDTLSTGLGRMDLRERTDTNGAATPTPAYASDLMATGQGAVLSVVTFGDQRAFAVSGLGFYGQSANKVASGTIDSGLITYGLPDPKITFWLDIRHTALAGTITASIATDGSSSFTSLGESATASTYKKVLPAAEALAEKFEIRLGLARSASDTTQGPTLTRWTLEANPAPGRGQFIHVPLLLRETVKTNAGATGRDPKADFLALIEMETSGRRIAFQSRAGTYDVLLDDHDFIIDGETSKAMAFFNGCFVVQLRKPRTRST